MLDVFFKNPQIFTISQQHCMHVFVVENVTVSFLCAHGWKMDFRIVFWMYSFLRGLDIFSHVFL